MQYAMHYAMHYVMHFAMHYVQAGLHDDLKLRQRPHEFEHPAEAEEANSK